MPFHRSVIVTCPSCEHTHTVDVPLDDLEIDDSVKEYSLRQVEKILGLSRATLKRYIYEGLLLAEKSGSGSGGSKWMVSHQAILEFRRSRLKSI